MKNNKKQCLHFGHNEVMCPMGEFSINDRVFYSMVYRKVKPLKKILSFFLGKSGKNGKCLQNNRLEAQILTKNLPSYQNILVTHFRRCRLPENSNNIKLYCRQVPP
jgi:hypothetical protein